MGNLTRLTLDFIRHLSKAIRASRIYAANHRETQKSIDDAFADLGKMIQEESAIVLGTRDGSLILQNAPLHDDSPAVKGFCEALADRNIDTFRVEPGFTPQEFDHFLKLLVMSPEEVLRDHAIRPELLEPLRAFRVNEMKFIAVRGDAPEGATLGFGAALPNDLTAMLSSLLSGAPTDPSGSPDATRAGGPGLRSLGAALAPFLKGGEKGQAVELTSRLFDQIVDQSLSDRPAAEFVDEYLKGMGSLPEEVRNAVLTPGGGEVRALDPQSLIERLPIGLRGRVVAEDLLRGGTSIGKLRATVTRLAPTPADFVRLFEIVSRTTAESSASPQEREQRSEELLRLLPLSEELKRKRRSILLFARDSAEQAVLTRTLEEAGFLATGYGSPDAILVALLRTGAYDAVVADISRYHLSEMQALARTEPGAAPLPTVLLEDTLRVRDAAEMASCPEARLLYKPVETPELLATLDELVPRPPGDAPPPPAGEVEQAREMKPFLQPREMPTIPGYTTAALHRAGSQSGGNCHEVLALPGKRYGLFLLDVPGHGAVAPAALFAARSGLLRAALQNDTAGRTLSRLNDALGRALPRGTFVRASYAILDPASGQLSVACAGIPPPLRWTDGNPAVKMIQASGLPAGPAPVPLFDRVLRPVTVTLAQGDHVLFYTGGVLQALNPALSPFGERRVAQTTRLVPEGPAGLAVVEVLEAVLGHVGAKPLWEDLTLLELHREKEEPPGPAR